MTNPGQPVEQAESRCHRCNTLKPAPTVKGFGRICSDCRANRQSGARNASGPRSVQPKPTRVQTRESLAHDTPTEET